MLTDSMPSFIFVYAENGWNLLLLALETLSGFTCDTWLSETLFTTFA